MNSKVVELLHKHFNEKDQLRSFVRRTALMSVNWKPVSGSHAIFRVEQPILVFKGAGTLMDVPEHGKTRMPVIVELVLPRSAVFHMASNSDKCRASRAAVHAMYTPDGKKVETARAWHDWTFVYETGERVKPRGAFDRRMRVCAQGIHFYFDQRFALTFAQDHFG